MSSTLIVLMGQSADVLSAPGGRASTSKSLMSLRARPGPHLQVGDEKFAYDRNIDTTMERRLMSALGGTDTRITEKKIKNA